MVNLKKILTIGTPKLVGQGGYEVAIVSTKCDLCNFWVIAVLYKISRYVGPHYNRTRL